MQVLCSNPELLYHYLSNSENRHREPATPGRGTLVRSSHFYIFPTLGIISFVCVRKQFLNSTDYWVCNSVYPISGAQEKMKYFSLTTQVTIDFLAISKKDPNSLQHKNVGAAKNKATLVSCYTLAWLLYRRRLYSVQEVRRETLFRRGKYALLALQREGKLCKQVPCVLPH